MNPTLKKDAGTVGLKKIETALRETINAYQLNRVFTVPSFRDWKIYHILVLFGEYTGYHSLRLIYPASERSIAAGGNHKSCTPGPRFHPSSIFVVWYFRGLLQSCAFNCIVALA